MPEHEIRDAVHVFIRLDSHERMIVDSWPLQRLRHIHQLALSHLVYPGAGHSRLEHSLGVMDLAGRVFDVVTRPANVTDEVRHLLPEIADERIRPYWRAVLRFAALSHDIGHPPFSHAAERALLPEGWNHERMTRVLLSTEPLRSMLEASTPPVRVDDVAKLAVGTGKAADLVFSNWEAILSEIIVGDAFGVDRMDYLLRDSHHAGVVYGRFDQDRLIDTLRVLPRPAPDDEPAEPQLGIEHGGLHTAEALLLARYFMYSQVYFHPVRMALDLHLIDFLRGWLPGGMLPVDPTDHLALTDNEVFAAMREALVDDTSPNHVHARRILAREHFRVLHRVTPDDLAANIDPSGAILAAVRAQFGEGLFERQRQFDTGGSVDFPVRQRDGTVVSSTTLSGPLRDLPTISADYIFVAPEVRRRAASWLYRHRQEVLTAKEPA